MVPKKTKCVVVITLLVMVSLVLFGEQLAWASCVTPPPDLVSWWPGDGNTQDIVGSNPGTLVNGAIYGAGKVGQAFSLDGVDDYVDVGSGFDLDDMTLDAWVLIDPVENVGEQRVISKDNYLLPGTRKEFSLKSTSVAWAGNGRPTFQVLIGASFDVIGAPAALTAGWHHLAAVRDTSASRFELYVDGAMVASAAPTVVGPINSAVNTVIGRVNPAAVGAIEHFDGRVDEVEIFDRALSAGEIWSIYSAGGAGKCKPSTGVNRLPIAALALTALLIGFVTVSRGFLISKEGAK